ncbi:MAG: flagellar biosynthesis protein flip [Pseudoduganella sp.]|jgi:flagellar biosynthetic protein FliP|nr:flagellar biosynthesis protein flip [Pseudoduganella sp.]
MSPRRLFGVLLLALLSALAAWPGAVLAAAPAALSIDLGGAAASQSALRIILGLTVLSLAPAILVSMTAFIRIIVVLSMLRHALGTQETPPNTVLVSLALFLTLFTMAPVLEQVNRAAFQPYMAGKLSTSQALERGSQPLRDFMVRQTRESDMALMVELSKKPMPASADEVGMAELIPAFMLSELRAAFQIGFVVLLPFLLIDLLVSTLLMALGMMMVPPVTVALPVKILMFVLIDGWSLVVKALLGTFH